ncbi:outer membrane protein assembly factor BamB family protein [Desulfotomaculum sp. 1211_IL3151]|uniref:outer membrane protein assembly factor BamB family protein n=1 Tax=Desulfotomaculum sp. 1211_IL3151 TaxID=3084055 RepID=UPI002FDA2A34
MFGYKKGNLFFMMLLVSYTLWLNHLTGQPIKAEANTTHHTTAGSAGHNQKFSQEPVRLTDVIHTSNSISEKLFHQVKVNDQLVEKYQDTQQINMDSDYSSLAGVTCFRGNNYRDTASYGIADMHKGQLRVVWSRPIGRLGEWTGVGWNGQPAIVQWDDEWKNKMNISPAKKQREGLKEVIYATLDGNVYFLDLEDGEYTRPVIKIPGPVKGSVSVDPRGLPLLYVGQGIDSYNGRRVEMGYRIFSLLDQHPLFFLPGYDPFAYRNWGAFDSTALVDSKTDTMLLGGENGILYKVKLNSFYNEQINQITVKPDIIRYRYKVVDKGNHQGIENSVVIYKNYAYFADNGGVLQCVDTNQMKPVWARDVTDDTDSTLVLEEEEPQRVFLYTACEVDLQGNTGKSYLRKFDALSGEPQWEKQYKCYLNTHTNGGALATPVLGKQDIANLVIYNLARCGTPNGGLLVALDKDSGEEVWKLNLPNYCWSSPVAVYAPNGEGFLVVCDSVGRMYFIKGKTGQIFHYISLGANIEGSPAVFDNMIVVGTRGQKIYGVCID